MKKFISILLALTLVLSLGVVAFAEGVAQDTAPVVPKNTRLTTVPHLPRLSPSNLRGYPM